MNLRRRTHAASCRVFIKNEVDIKDALGDGAYDKEDAFKFMKEKNVSIPGIKIRKNAKVGPEPTPRANAVTAEFAVESIRQWWNLVGKYRYAGCKDLLICADGGGSNGSRNRG